MENIYYSVDRIENDYIVLENIKTGNIVNVKKSYINFEVIENDILLFDGEKYQKDSDKKMNLINDIRRKMNDIKKS